MPAVQSKETKMANAILFIEAARELIDTEGMENLSIRKIAAKAGFHNSTIYLYFKDLDHLVMLASLKHFADYSHALVRLSGQDMNPKERFFAVWEFFGDTVFEKPNLFYHFFFGKYSDNLTEIMEEYYSYFPGEREEYSQILKEMYFGKNIEERCLSLLKTLSSLNTRVTEDSLTLANDVIVCCLKTLLEEKSRNPQADSGLYTRRLEDMIRFVIGI